MRHILLFIVLIFAAFWAGAKTVKYELTATKGSINLSGKNSTLGHRLIPEYLCSTRNKAGSDPHKPLGQFKK